MELNDEEPNTSQLEGQLRDYRSKIQQLELELKRSNTNNNRYSNAANNKIKCQILEETLENTLEHNETLEKQLKEAANKILNLNKQITTLNTNFNMLSLEKDKLEHNYKNLQVEHNRLKKLNNLPNTRITSYISEMIENASLKIVGAQTNPGTNLTNFILYLGHKMDVHYVRSDIIRAVFSKDEQALLVQFKDYELCKTFYNNEYKLAYYNETENIEFYDVDHDEFSYNTLFDYALNLKMFNYKSVFRQNKKVMARKNDYEDVVRIYSKEHIEELIEEEKSSETRSTYIIF